MMNTGEFRKAILEGIPSELPGKRPWDPSVDHAPVRKDILTTEEKKLAIRNALRYNRPQTALEAKFSLEFGVTMILLTGKAGIHQYTDEIVMSSQVQRFLDRVHCSIDPQMDALGSDKMHTAIRIHIEDGRSFEKEASIARGYPERPFSVEDNLVKFQECAETVVDKDAGEAVWRLLMNLEELPSVNEITKYLVPKT